MRYSYYFLLAAVIIVAPLPVAAQVSIDLNALNALGAADLPAPPPRAPRSGDRFSHKRHRLARSETKPQPAQASAVASASPDAIEHPADLGPSFASLPTLPGAAPPVPAKPPTPRLAEAPAAPPLALPVAVPAPPPILPPAILTPPTLAPPTLAHPAVAAATPARLAEVTPPPPAAQPIRPHVTPDALPKGADRLTLPFFVDESDLPSAENAMVRDFATRYGGAAQYTIRAFATSPAGDDDPSTPRRIALARAQSVAAALMQSGVQPDRLRLLALGSAGGAPADRVEVIATPPSSGHTNAVSSP